MGDDRYVSYILHILFLYYLVYRSFASLRMTVGSLALLTAGTECA